MTGAPSASILQTLAWCRTLAFPFIIWFDNGKWMLIGVLRWLTLCVVCAAACAAALSSSAQRTTQSRMLGLTLLLIICANAWGYHRGVLACSFIWVPVKGIIFFDLDQFASGSDEVDGTDSRWVAVTALVLGTLFPLVEALLFKVL